MQDADYVEFETRRRDGSIGARFRVSSEDAGWVSENRWHLTADGYIRRTEWVGKNSHTVLLARAVVGLEKGDPLTVDHMNRDPLDNRRENLRIVTRLAQMQNVSGRGNTSQFRGVSASFGKWRAQASDGVRFHKLGTFDTEEEAAAVAKAFRLRHQPYAVD